MAKEEPDLTAAVWIFTILTVLIVGSMLVFRQLGFLDDPDTAIY